VFSPLDSSHASSGDTKVERFSSAASCTAEPLSVSASRSAAGVGYAAGSGRYSASAGAGTRCRIAVLVALGDALVVACVSSFSFLQPAKQNTYHGSCGLEPSSQILLTCTTVNLPISANESVNQCIHNIYP
jgi:hypothetical protein